MTIRRICSVAVALLVLPAVAQAHVSITPRESTQGATEKYVVRIPTEGKVATIAADLEVPDGVLIETLQAPAGWKHEVTRRNDRIATIKWTVDVKPGEFVEVAFVGLNPRDKTELVWKLKQYFADGTTTDWTTAPSGSTRPTAVTKLIPRAASTNVK
jgi:uncharacterized protein YcnI